MFLQIAIGAIGPGVIAPAILMVCIVSPFDN